MSFSDDDLKRLKEDCSKGKTLLVATDNLETLLARLEAAEAVIAEADQNGFSDKAIELETAWRKSKDEAGK